MNNYLVPVNWIIYDDVDNAAEFFLSMNQKMFDLLGIYQWRERRGY